MTGNSTQSDPICQATLRSFAMGFL